MSEEGGIDVVNRRGNKKKSLLGIFGKRVSRVEPDPRHLDSANYYSEGEVTPVLRRSQNNNNSGGKAIAKSTPINRLSGNFTFCCSANSAIMSPIDTDDIPVVKPTIRSRDHLKLELETLENWKAVDDVRTARRISKSAVSYKLLEANSNGLHVRPEVSLQKPITESKSRFRNRYLPPSDAELSNNSEYRQHSSTPDIAQKGSSVEREPVFDRK